MAEHDIKARRQLANSGFPDGPEVDEQKLSVLLSKIAEEDPTFKWHTDRQTHEVVINGIGELHLRLILEKLSNRGLRGLF